MQRLGWFQPLHLHGVWAYVPPGEDEINDPYIDIRGWKARDPDTVCAIAGEAAAWHLGYLDRAFNGPVAVWMPRTRRLPHGLRRHLSIVTLGWDASEARRVGPTTSLLHRRGLDLTGWAGGLPAFGPEALIVQLSARPASFRSWADLVPHLAQLATDCDIDRVVGLLARQSPSAWQRTAYLLHRGNRHSEAADVLAQRPAARLSKVQFGTGPTAAWIAEFGIVDHLVAALQHAGGKA